jgi:hypothetical protein
MVDARWPQDVRAKSEMATTDQGGRGGSNEELLNFHENKVFVDSDLPIQAGASVYLEKMLTSRWHNT